MSPFPEEDVVALTELIGVDRVLFGSDWPHPEGNIPPARLRRVHPEARPGRRQEDHARQPARPPAVVGGGGGTVALGAGEIGIRALRATIQHPGLQLAGLVVHRAAKQGRDAGDLRGLPRPA